MTSPIHLIPTCPRSFRGITNKKRELEDEVTIIPQNYLLCPPKSSTELPTTLFPLQFPKSSGNQEVLPQTKMAQYCCFLSPKFKFQQIISKFIFITEILYWIILKSPGNMQEMPHDDTCWQAHQLVNVPGNTFEQLWFGKVLINHGVQFLTKVCTLVWP